MTEVFILKCGDALPEERAVLLPRWRRRRLERLRYAPAREASLGAGLLWRYVMERHGVHPEEPIRFLQAGKPVFAQRDDLHFSLAHSGDYAMCAISDQQVGVDVQKIKPIHMSVARRFHFRERDWLAEQPHDQQQNAFFQIWARKEAWVKAVSQDQLLSLDQEDVIHGADGWQFGQYELDNGYVAAVCAHHGETVPEPIVVQPDELVAALTHGQPVEETV